ncbi:energy-coupling factor ABC transporter ATP-binding protein [Bacillus sp. 165]|uniref:energy-coupling factor ABC transporter ATP-binding protein n=1 Tax=Bacillus sp. 165 TaxID=1529117 RepID=UPI001ADD1D1D|nr:energy-coupling factor ABC transporter ATP-binding protein [Bacillus sp. 165]MBO9131123.1 energy-coupling factor ABC transporter ATP-binding protein [Bacillus sp. 165]
MDISFQKVEHRYQKGTPFERQAIYNINLMLESKKYYAVIGHTGSGKSTIIQHLNGLLQPTSGTVEIGEFHLEAKKKEKKLKPLRKKVGVVFQFPEHQLFEETVEKDICFGPMNFGVSQEEAKKQAKIALDLVGLPEEYLTKSPFELSGGQMRRVAIAGILAMEPEVLVLDEPTAGLDPKGQEELMGLFYRLHKEQGLTVILVTHNMEDAARYADEIIVLHRGTIFLQGTPAEIFARSDELDAIGLSLPLSLQYKKFMEQKLGVQLLGSALTLEDLSAEIIATLNTGDVP